MNVSLVKSIVNHDMRYLIRDIEMQLQVTKNLLAQPRDLTPEAESWYKHGLERQKEILEGLLKSASMRHEFMNESIDNFSKQ